MKPRRIILPVVALAALTVPYPAPPQPDLASLPKDQLQSARPPRPEDKPGFLSFAFDSPHPFVPVIGSDPERICDRLDEAGFANFGWRGAEISGIWECMARLEEAPVDISQDDEAEPDAGEGLDAAGPPAKENSLFYLLRGTSRQRLAYARMKLNLLEPQNEDELLGRAREFLEVLADAARFRLPQEIAAAVLAKQPVTVWTAEATFKLKPEFDDPRRFNLSIEFGPALRAFHQSEYRAAGPAPGNGAADETVSVKEGGNNSPDKRGRLRPDG
ncbi:hypothetical protein KEU06_12895 [Pseudaminobacter sp. 19-2017]|uniref:Uncharacterized protein n=1 Tax=Pseudaminobacter soli (ex Zhang et al. 2022) TaxID=2831468 RepID=A0A942I9L4_9HYPH|nr:DUF6030 family protein [Pseudaminobacter soli]MBS3649506.1 hypothetical protein [Pseudaminobacter soli]